MRKLPQFSLWWLFLLTLFVALATVAYVRHYRHSQAISQLEEMGCEIDWDRNTNLAKRGSFSILRIRRDSNVDIQIDRLKAALAALHSLAEFSAPELGLGRIGNINFLSGVKGSLKILDLGDGYDGDIEHLVQFKNLKQLTVSKEQFDCAGLEALEFLKTLSVRADQLENLQDLLSVTELSLESVDSYDNLNQLSGLQLQHLSLSFMSLNDINGAVGSAQSLRSLYIDGCDISDLGILRKMQNVAHLRMTNSNIEGFPEKLNLPELRIADCTGTNLQSLEAFAGLTSLEDLSVEIDCDDSVLRVVDFPSLVRLSISLSEVRKISISNCPKLRSIVLTDCKVSRDVVRQFSQEANLVKLRFATGPFAISEPVFVD